MAKVIIILGPPGSGKGTQSDFICQKLKLSYIGSGELLRARKKRRDFTGLQIACYIDIGKRVPTPAIFYLWMAEFEKIKKTAKLNGFIIDGSPRSVLEAEMLDLTLSWYDWEKNQKVIYIKLSPQESVRRLTKRRQCAKCSEVIPYFGEFKAMKKCPQCGGELVARPDDTIQGVKERLKWFKTDVVPAINYYRKKGILLTINGEQSIENVSRDILKALKQF
ncbi:MAG: nucleoside monophosphate kinase [Patescibacteria group bacterium]